MFSSFANSYRSRPEFVSSVIAFLMLMVGSHGLVEMASCFGLAAACSRMAYAAEPAAAQPSGAPSNTPASIDIGWNGLVRLGTWNVATATIPLAAEADCELTCRALDSDGHTAIFSSGRAKHPAGVHHLSVEFQVGRPNATIAVAAVVDGKVVAEHTLRLGETEPDSLPLKLQDRIVVTVGKPRGFAALNQTVDHDLARNIRVIELPDAARLPTVTAAYDVVDVVVLTGASPLDAERSAALRSWVQRGGRLVVSLPKDSTEFQQSPLAGWLPISLGKSAIQVRELAALELLAGRNLRIPFAGRVAVADISSSTGTVLAASRDEELLIRAPYGFGTVTLLGLDLTQAPLANWGAVEEFSRYLTGIAAEAATDGKPATTGTSGQLTSSGITDLASQLQACLDRFDSIHRPAPWWSMAWMLGLLAVLGPLDYWLVHKILGRPQWTWVTLPIWILISLTFGASAGPRWSDSRDHASQIDVISIDIPTGSIRGSSWLTLYSATTQREDVQVKAPSQDFGGTAQTTSRLGWFSIPEGTPGGLYREGGVEWGRTSYHVEPLAATITELPLQQWATRTLQFDWTGHADGLLEGELQSNGLGRLTGRLVHHLPGTLSDWMLAYGSRAFQLQTSRTDATIVDWTPGTELSTNDALFFQGDLRGVLTRMSTTLEAGPSGGAQPRVRREQARYDPTQRDPFRLWQVVTFHDTAGGEAYSGLRNSGLPAEDLSRHLADGQAVLFGRLKMASPIRVDVNQQTLSPERQDVFVRIVIPVRKSGEIVRELKRLTGEDDKPEK